MRSFVVCMILLAVVVVVMMPANAGGRLMEEPVKIGWLDSDAGEGSGTTFDEELEDHLVASRLHLNQICGLDVSHQTSYFVAIAHCHGEISYPPPKPH